MSNPVINVKLQAEGGEETSGEKQGAKRQDQKNKRGKDDVEKDEKPDKGVKETESEQIEKKETTKKSLDNDDQGIILSKIFPYFIQNLEFRCNAS